MFSMLSEDMYYTLGKADPALHISSSTLHGAGGDDSAVVGEDVLLVKVGGMVLQEVLIIGKLLGQSCSWDVMGYSVLESSSTLEGRTLPFHQPRNPPVMVCCAWVPV